MGLSFIVTKVLPSDIFGALRPDTPLKNQASISTKEAVALGVVGMVYLFIALHAAATRTLWFDELSTLFMATPPSWAAMFRAIPTDGNPPLYFVLARLCLHLPLKTELALRLPAVVAYLVAAGCIFRFTRAMTAPTFAWLGASIFLGSQIHSFALEARPYSLLLAFTGVCLCGWQSYRLSAKRIHLLTVFTGIAGAIFSHQYGVIYAIVPLLAGEAVRWFRVRKIDLPLLATIALGAAAISLTFPPMFRGQAVMLAAIRACPVFWARPQLSDLSSYAEMVPRFIPVIAGVAATLWLLMLALSKNKTAATKSVEDAAPEYFAAAFTLSLFVPLMLIATHFGSGYFQMRYAAGSAMGISILTALIAWSVQIRWSRMVQIAQAVILYNLMIGIIGIYVVGTGVVKPSSDAVLNAGDLGEPIVIAGALQFSQIWWYSGDRERARYHYLVDLAYAAKRSDLVPEFSLALEQPYLPMRLDDYHVFLSTHPRFLLYCYGQSRLEWIKQRLQQEGWNLTIIQSGPSPGIPGEKRQTYRELYQVTR